MGMPAGLETVLSWLGGGLGLMLRKRLFPPLFDSCGRNVIFGRWVRFRCPEKMVIGDRTVISDRTVLDASGFRGNGNALTLEAHVFVGNRNRIVSTGGSVHVGSGANLSSCCTIFADQPIVIGKDTLLAAYCTIGDRAEERETQCTVFKYHGNPAKAGTRIGSGCWLGVRVHVTDGVWIGDGTIVGAHSIVRTSLGSYVVAVGAPARIIKRRQ